MPLILRGRSKARLELQWDGPSQAEIRIVPQSHMEITMYQASSIETRLQLELDQLDFSRLSHFNELELMAIAEWREGGFETKSEILSIQRCHHNGCRQWGHVREDGYCRHCGRRIKRQGYSHGFAKLENSSFAIKLWNGIEGRLWKKKETREIDNGVFSMGRYEDKNHSRDFVEIFEEKYDQQLAERFTKLCKILEKTELMGQYWKPPLASFQEEHQRSLWIYPVLPKQKKWRKISALSYIFSKDVSLLSTYDIVHIGIILCNIIDKIQVKGFLWASIKLSDLILTRNKRNEISLYLTTRDIAWGPPPSKDLLDTCLLPWELFWEHRLPEGYEITEVYIVATLLYLLKAKTPNLLAYNSISYPYGLPTLKLFEHSPEEPSCDTLPNYFEVILNQALLLNPNERGYKSVSELRSALNQLLQNQPKAKQNKVYQLDVGECLDVGNEKREHDLSINQDGVFITSYTLERESWGVFVLCDGVSTATVGSGDLASRIVIDTFEDWWGGISRDKQRKVCEYASSNFDKARRSVLEVVSEANRRIKIAAEKIAPPEILEEAMVMGSTITIGIIHGRSIVFGWLGDSPLYRINPFYGWERLNYEHNERNYRLKEGMPLEECFFEGGNALTHCVGAHFHVEDTLTMPFGRSYLYPGEHILACSDGVPDYIEKEAAYACNENYQMLRIASILYEYENDSLLDAKALASILVSSANRIGGGFDNLAAILIKVLPEGTMVCDQAYHRLKALSKSMQTVMRQTNLDTRRIIPSGKRVDQQPKKQ